MRHFWSLGAGAIVAAGLGFWAVGMAEIAIIAGLAFLLLAGLLALVMKLARKQTSPLVISGLALFLTVAIPMTAAYLWWDPLDCAEEPCVVTIRIAPSQ